jgi:hypothetical protein
MGRGRLVASSVRVCANDIRIFSTAVRDRMRHAAEVICVRRARMRSNHLATRRRKRLQPRCGTGSDGHTAINTQEEGGVQPERQQGV